MYSPTVGRFIERDPTGYAAGDQDLYGYTHAHPTSATDPTGLSTYTAQAEKIVQVVAAKLDAKSDTIEITALVESWKVCCDMGPKEVVNGVLWTKLVPYSKDGKKVDQLEKVYKVGGAKFIGVTDDKSALQFAQEAYLPHLPAWWNNAHGTSAACLAANGPDSFVPDPNYKKWKPGQIHPVTPYQPPRTGPSPK